MEYTPPNESGEEREIRHTLSLEKMKAESKILQIKADKSRSQYKQKDDGILAEIAKHQSYHVQQKLEELWYDECQKEEDKSKKMWETKIEWFKQLETKALEETENPQKDQSTSQANNQINRRRQNGSGNGNNRRPRDSTNRTENNRGKKEKRYRKRKRPEQPQRKQPANGRRETRRPARSQVKENIRRKTGDTNNNRDNTGRNTNSNGRPDGRRNRNQSRRPFLWQGRKNKSNRT